MPEFQFEISFWNCRSMTVAICIGLWMLGYPELLRHCRSIIVLWVAWKYGKTLLWHYWRLIYYCTGLFIWHYLCKGLVWAVSPRRNFWQSSLDFGCWVTLNFCNFARALFCFGLDGSMGKLYCGIVGGLYIVAVACSFGSTFA